MVRKEFPLAFVETIPLHLIVFITEVQRLLVRILWTIEGKFSIWRLSQHLHSLIFAPVPCLSACRVELVVFDASQAFNVILFGPSRGPDDPVTKLKYGG